MKVKCIKNVLDGQEFVNATGYNFTKRQEYCIAIGQEYIVMGLMLLKRASGMNYLVLDDGFPSWYPQVLFEIIDPELPANWFAKPLNTNETGGTITFLSGFYELCMNDDFYDALMEGEEWALKIYNDRKNELLKQSEVGEFIKQSKSHINIDFERWKLLELFDEERFEASEGQTIDYILRTDDNCIFALYIAPFDGYAVITLKKADTSNVIFEMEIDNVCKIDCTKTALLFYKRSDRQENDPADVVVSIKPKVHIS